MYKIIIVDDEKMVIESIKGKIKWDKLNAELVAEARNGLEALEKIRELSPDIAIIDMKMPICNGLELLDILESNHCKTRIIVSSAYTDYEYTRKALNNQVVDYLVKPLKTEELNCAIQKAISQINISRNKKDEILSRLLRKNNEHQIQYIIEDIKKISSMYSSKAYGLILIEMQGITEVYKEQIFKCFSLNKFHGSQMFVNMNEENEIVILFSFENPSNDNETRIKDYATLLLSGFIEKHYKAYISIGGICKSLIDIYSIYSKASYAVKQRNIFKHEVCEYNPENFSQASNDIIVKEEKRNKLNYFLRHNNRENIMNQIGDIFEDFSKEKILNTYHVTAILSDLVLIVNEFLNVEDKLKCTPEIFENLLAGSIYMIDKIEYIKTSFILLLEPAIDRIILNHLDNPRRIVYETKQYIDTYYYKELRLKEFAEKHLLSEEYFSKLFKNEIKEGFVDYITRVRLLKAKELVLNSSIKLYEISSLVGYSDSKYFCKLFKKNYNVTPSNMRKAILSGNSFTVGWS